VRADEGALLRAVRLRALGDSPHAFAATLAEEQALSEPEWTARAAAAASGSAEIIVLAIGHTGHGLGMAGGRVREEPGVISLWGMWVDPAARRGRLGARLVDAVGDWARTAGAHTFRLGVMDDAPAAVGFYERIGFTIVTEEYELTPVGLHRGMVIELPIR
jgi:ribosomal protein S18 acetylase RimI-like enzyme